MCRAAQEAGAPHSEYINRKKENAISHLCNSVIPYPIGTEFDSDMPASCGSLHTKFEENRSSWHFRDTSEQNFVLISSFFSYYYYQIYHNGRHTQKAKPVQGVSHKKEHYNYKNIQQTNNYKTAQQYKNIN